MNDLINLIQGFSEEEKDGFLAFAKARNKRNDVHNIKLFQLLRAGERGKIDVKIYGCDNKNALYGLKNRLEKSLIEFIAIQGFEKDQKNQMAALKLLLASRLLLQKNSTRLGLKTLKKAQSLAKAAELFTVLHEIYLTFLQYSHLFPTVDQNELSQLFQMNKQRIAKADRIALLFSNHKNTSGSVKEIDFYRSQLQELQIKISHDLSFKNLYELLEIFTDAASLAGSYHLIADELAVIESAFSFKETPQQYSSHYHDLKLLLGFSFFRISQFEKTQHYLSSIDLAKKLSSEQFNNMLILRSLSLNYTGRPMEAIKGMEEVKNLKMDGRCVLAMFYLQQKQPQIALRQLNKLKHRDSYYEKHYSKSIIVKKNLLLLIIYIDLGNVNLIDSQISRLQKKSSEIKTLNDNRVMDFIKIATAYYNNPKIVDVPKFKDQLSALATNDLSEDIFTMSIYAWLLSKLRKRSLYEVTLELVSG